jgi:hypothetical protein
MTTTALLVDILIIGVQVLVWILLLLTSFFVEPHYAKAVFNQSPVGLSFLFIVAAYTVGIISDYIGGMIFMKFKDDEEVKLYNNVSIIDIIATDKEIHVFLNNYYERLRIARGTLINLPFITFSSFCYCIMNCYWPHKAFYLLSILFFGIIITFLAFISWRSRNNTYRSYIKRVKERLEELKTKTT